MLAFALGFAGSASGQDAPLAVKSLSKGCAQADGCPVPADQAENAATRFDWALGLRGTYVMRNGLGSWQSGISPKASVTTSWQGGAFDAGAEAALVVGDDGRLEIGSGTASAKVAHRLGLGLEARATGGMTISREAQTASIAHPAYQVDGNLEAGLAKTSGRLTLSGAATASRRRVSNTGNSDGSWTSNAVLDRTGLGLKGGAELALTPIISLTGEGSAERLWYDHADPLAGTFRDGTRYQLRGGVKGGWPNGLNLSGYLGYAWRDFENAGFSAEGAAIYGLGLDYALPQGGKISAAYDNNFSAPANQNGASARIDETLSFALAVPLSRVLTARASAGVTTTRYLGSWQTAAGYNGGLGVDWRLSRQVSLAADYGYSFSQTSTEITETHRFSAGMNVRR